MFIDLEKEDITQTVTRLMNEGDPKDPQHKPLNYQRASALAVQMLREAEMVRRLTAAVGGRPR